MKENVHKWTWVNFTMQLLQRYVWYKIKRLKSGLIKRREEVIRITIIITSRACTSELNVKCPNSGSFTMYNASTVYTLYTIYIFNTYIFFDESNRWKCTWIAGYQIVIVLLLLWWFFFLGRLLFVSVHSFPFAFTMLCASVIIVNTTLIGCIYLSFRRYIQYVCIVAAVLIRLHF